eukprot:UN05174
MHLKFHIWHYLYIILASAVEIASLFFTGRVVHLLLTNPKSHAYSCTFHLPLIFYTVIANISYLISNLSQLVTDSRCENFMWTHNLGLFGAFGIPLAGLLSIWLPFEVLRKPSLLDRLDNGALIQSFAVVNVINVLYFFGLIACFNNVEFFN